MATTPKTKPADAVKPPAPSTEIITVDPKAMVQPTAPAQGEDLEKRKPLAPRAAVKIYTELPTQSFTGFDTLDQVKSAIRNLETGQFNQATALIDAMTRDERLAAALMLRSKGLDVLPMEFEEGEGTAAADAMKELADRWHVFFPEAELAKLRKWARMTGLGVAENRWVYDPKSGRVEPRLHTWYPRWVWWNWGTRSFWMNCQEGTVELTPQTGQWVLYAPDGLYMAWMTGLVRSLYVPWLLRQWSLRDSGRYSEAFGGPIKKASFPSGIDDDQRDKFMTDVARLASESTIGLPSEASDNELRRWDIELLELKGTGGDLFEKLINLANVNIAVGILGTNLLVEVQGGSYSAAQVHASIRGDILQSDSNSLSSCLHTDTLHFWALWNFGDPYVAPKGKWNTKPPEDKKAQSEAFKGLGEAIKALATSGVPVDMQKLTEAFGVPLREEASEDEKRIPRIIDANLVAAGVPTVNEAREVIGDWDSVEGGDEIPAVNPPEPEPEKPGDGKTKKKEEARMSDVPVPTVEGQLYIDKLGEQAIADAKKARHREMVMLLAAVESAKTFDELKDFITKAYAKLDDGELAEVMRKALLLGEYAGRDFAQEER